MNAEIKYSNEILPEVLEMCKRINAKLKEAGNPVDIKGWKVWYSDIIEKPNFLFIGINPNNIDEDIEYFGGNVIEVDGLKVQLEPDQENRYNSDKDWTLSKNTRDVFELADLDILSNVKTNYYFLGSNKSATLNTLDNFIGESLNTEFRNKSAEWSKKIIDLVSPKVIICEGIEAYDNVINHALKFEKDKITKILVSGNIRKASYDNIIIIGYARSEYSNISQETKIELVKELKLLKEHKIIL